MGAIYGFCSSSYLEKSDNLIVMEKALKFRGNINKQYRDSGIEIGILKHFYETGSRLIIDKERSIIAACEGEIYNNNELMKTLKDTSKLSEKPDGFELVPSLYFEKGRDFPRLINGVFTIALWDGNNKSLHLVRDHLGSHSVFYAVRKNSIIFSTNTKAIFDTAYFQTEIDLNGLNKYLSSLAINPPNTIFKNIFTLRPGYMTTFKQGEISEYPYWPIYNITEDQRVSKDHFSDKILEIFLDAVKIRVKSCQSCGALVSGGIDTSSIVSALCSIGTISSLKGFSVSFNEVDYSDAPLQKHIYDKYNIEPNEIVLGPAQFADALVEGSSYLDCPVNDMAYAGMLIAIERAKNSGCNVIFEGEGSDEIFCTGHSMGEFSIQKFLHFPFELRRLLLGWAVSKFPIGSSITDKVIRLCARIGMSDIERRSTWIPGFTTEFRRQLLRIYPENLNDPYNIDVEYYKRSRLKDMLNIYQYGLTRMFLPNDLLFKNERMAAAKGILNRTPFIDFRLVEEAFLIPAKYKMQKPSSDNDGTKVIFKNSIKKMIPNNILCRKKRRGFSQPTGIWFQGPLEEFVYDKLFSSGSKVTSYLDSKMVKRIYDLHKKGLLSSDYYINSLLILELWMRHHI